MIDDDDDFTSTPLSDVQKINRFKLTISEIANLIVNNLRNSKLELVGQDSNQQYLITVEDKLLIKLNVDGYKLFFQPERRKPIGSWSSFLEGGPDTIAESVFLKELAQLDYECY
ncbi:MAG: hypothetical protein JHD01_05770, partial [Candidatus Nanopelagicales bacterium]|nr:hypothetical protein [Candidatus Nanopelagicales bacterium]